mmetsp:Transcript_6366/g.14095  ORF Transcript_6366/g.14095 Transcript_6366/m.14095 type:complete len:215 (+) Transcript_6366:102-746(+)
MRTYRTCSVPSHTRPRALPPLASPRGGPVPDPVRTPRSPPGLSVPRRAHLTLYPSFRSRTIGYWTLQLSSPDFGRPLVTGREVGALPYELGDMVVDMRSDARASAELRERRWRVTETHPPVFRTASIRTDDPSGPWLNSLACSSEETWTPSMRTITSPGCRLPSSPAALPTWILSILTSPLGEPASFSPTPLRLPDDVTVDDIAGCMYCCDAWR